MAATKPSTILLKGEPNRKERDSAGVITPGDLLLLNSSNTVIRNNVAEGVSNRWFAVENDIAGDDLNQDYPSGVVVQIHSATPGDEVLAQLADGETIVIGDFLESNGDGKLKKYLLDSAGVTQNDKSIVGMALQALDLLGGATVPDRIIIEVV